MSLVLRVWLEDAYAKIEYVIVLACVSKNRIRVGLRYGRKHVKDESKVIK